MLKNNHQQSSLYVIVPSGVIADAYRAIGELQVMGFKMVSNWHAPEADHKPFLVELIRMQQADVLIVWPSGLAPAQWLMIGSAHAIGMRIIAVGPLGGLDDDIKSFFMITVEGGFTALLADGAMLLGGADSLRYKRPKIRRAQ